MGEFDDEEAVRDEDLLYNDLEKDHVEVFDFSEYITQKTGMQDPFPEEPTPTRVKQEDDKKKD